MLINREMKSSRNAAICLALLALTASWFIPACFAMDASEASDAINQAEQDLGSAYTVVAEAERAGVNVSVLLNKLESAGSFLSEAYAAFGAGNYQNASLFAVDCSRAVQGVASDAARLKVDAELSRSDTLLLTTVGSCVGLILILFLGFLGWWFLKRRHFRRVLDMKPTVEAVL